MIEFQDIDIVSELGEICIYLVPLWLVWSRWNHSKNINFTHPRNKIVNEVYSLVCVLVLAKHAINQVP